MNRYILTASSFTGEVNVLYGLDGKILYIDFMKADLQEEQINWIKTKVPVIFQEGTFKEFAEKSRLDVVKEGYKVTFDMFWNRYEKKINKERCEKIWNKLSEADKVNAYFKLGMYERYLALNSWRTKMDPETYLKKGAWTTDWAKLK